MKLAYFGQAKPVRWRRLAIRIGQRILNRHAHIGKAHLCNNTMIHKFYVRMNDALRVNNDVYLIIRHIEQPSGLYNLKSFIDHCCGINCNLGSHRPIRMIKCLRNGHPFKLLPCPIAEGAARSRQRNLLDCILLLAI
ncbi:hypothetical protein D3C78_1128800 [compost metagenome]